MLNEVVEFYTGDHHLRVFLTGVTKKLNVLGCHLVRR